VQFKLNNLNDLSVVGKTFYLFVTATVGGSKKKFKIARKITTQLVEEDPP